MERLYVGEQRDLPRKRGQEEKYRGRNAWEVQKQLQKKVVGLKLKDQCWLVDDCVPLRLQNLSKDSKDISYGFCFLPGPFFHAT